MTPEPGSLSGRIKNRVESGSDKATEEGGLQKGRTLRDMRAGTAGGSEGLIKEPIDRQLLQKIFGQKLHEKPEVRDALEELMNAIDTNAGVREAFARLQEVVAKATTPQK